MKDKIKEIVASKLVERFLEILLLLIITGFLLLKSLITEKVLPSVSKELLAVMLVIALSLFLLACAYVVRLLHKLKVKNKPPDIADLIRDEPKRKILEVLARYTSLTLEDLISQLQLQRTHIEYHLNELEKSDYLYGIYIPGASPATYHLTQKGREFIIKNNLLPTNA